MAVGQLRAGYERQLAQEQGQTADEKAAAEQMGKASIEQIERMLKETDQVLWGLSARLLLKKSKSMLGQRSWLVRNSPRKWKSRMVLHLISLAC